MADEKPLVLPDRVLIGEPCYDSWVGWQTLPSNRNGSRKISGYAMGTKMQSRQMAKIGRYPPTGCFPE